MKKIGFEEAKRILTEVPDAILFDVREEEEFAVMHADGAQLFPVDSIDRAEAERLIGAKDTPVILYCRTGNRSALAASRLTGLGYENVYDLGSMVGWPYGMAYGTM